MSDNNQWIPPWIMRLSIHSHGWLTVTAFHDSTWLNCPLDKTVWHTLDCIFSIFNGSNNPAFLLPLGVPSLAYFTISHTSWPRCLSSCCQLTMVMCTMPPISAWGTIKAVLSSALISYRAQTLQAAKQDCLRRLRHQTQRVSDCNRV